MIHTSQSYFNCTCICETHATRKYFMDKY